MVLYILLYECSANRLKVTRSKTGPDRGPAWTGPDRTGPVQFGPVLGPPNFLIRSSVRTGGPVDRTGGPNNMGGTVVPLSTA